MSKSGSKRRRGIAAPPWQRLRQWGARGAATGLLTMSLALGAAANPSGGQVRHGNVNITPGLEMQIQQLTDKAIVDWQSFSIGSGETVRFLQPGQLSVILNRVVGVDPSTILGRMEANGNVFLINPNGILFGPGSVVNVGGLVASTLNLSNEDFLAGRYSFTQDPDKDLAAVVNQGTIRVTEGGYAVLSAPGVINEGTIIARTGKIALAAGERSTLNLDGRDLVHYTLDGQVSQGSILLAPGMMSEALAHTLGVPEARRADQLVRLADGSVRLERSSGTLVQSGTIRADGRAGADAGTVILDSADLTLVDSGSVTSASGVGTNSDGGQIYLLSEMNGNNQDRGNIVLRENATVAARGGVSGDGGFIEASGDRVLLQSHPDLRAPGGVAGLFLLDPPNVRIVDGAANGTVVGTETHYGDEFIETQLSMGSYLIDSTTNLISQMSAGVSVTSMAASNLTLTAATDIDLGDDVYDLGGSLTLDAGGDIALGSAQIDAVSLNLEAVGSMLFEDASITLSSGLDVLSSTLIDGGMSTIITGDDTTFQTDVDGADINFVDADLNAGGQLQVTSQGDVDLGTSHIVVPGNDFIINANTVSTTTSPNVDFNEALVEVAQSLTVVTDGDILLGTSQTLVDDDINLTTRVGDFDTENGIMRAGLNPAGPDFLGSINTDIEGRITKGGSQSTGYLAADVIRLLSDDFDVPSLGIDVNVNSTVHGGPIRISAAAVQEVFIRDLGTQGLVLIRKDGPADNIGGTLGSITSDSGFIQITSGGPIEFGIAQFVGATANDTGAPIVEILNPLTLANRTIVIRGSELVDGTRIAAGGPAILEVVNPNGTARLFSDNAVGAPGIGTIGVDAEGIEARGGAGGGIYLSNANTGTLDLLAFGVDGADLQYTDGSGNVLQYLDPGTGTRLLTSATAIDADTVILVFSDDVLVGELVMNPGQLLELKALVGASLLDGDTASATPNVTQATGSRLVLSAGDDVGSAASPFVVSGGLLAVSVGGDVTIDSDAALSITSETIPPVLGATMPATVNGVTAGGSIDISTGAGDLTLGAEVTSLTGDVLLASAASMNGASAISAVAGSVTIDAGANVSTSAISASDDVRIASGGLTSVAGTVTSTVGDIVIDSLGTVTISQALEALGVGGDVVVESAAGMALNATIEADTNVLLIAADDIVQGTSGLVTAAGLGLSAGDDIGSAADPFDFDADTVTVNSGGLAFLHSVGGPLTVGKTISVLGEGIVATGDVAGDLTLLVDNGSLLIDQAFGVTGDLMLETTGGGDLTLNESLAVGGNASLTSAADIVLLADLSSDQNLALDAAGNLLLDGAALDSAGDLQVTAGGDITLGADSQMASDLDLSAQAGGNLDVGSEASLAALSDIQVQGAGISLGDGASMTAGADLLATATTDLSLGQNSQVQAGGNTVLRAGGDISQGAGGRVEGTQVALSAGGDLVGANGGDVILSAQQLALQTGGQAFVRQVVGDLELVGSVSAAGVTATGGSVGTDMRVRVDDGQLTVSAPYAATNLALVTGTSLVGTTNQVGPGLSDIVLDDNLTATNSLVLLSAGNIGQVSGTLTAPNLGLGASGSIGAAGSPIIFDTNNLSVNQTNPFLNDPDGFQTTPQVTASMVTVNNQLVLPGPPTPEPPTPEPPTPGPTPGTPGLPSSVPTSEFNPDGRLAEALSSDRIDRVEEAIDQMLFDQDLLDQERVLEWWEDEDLLRKKRRI